MRWRLLTPIGLAVPAIHAAYAAQYLTVEQAQRAAFPSATAFVAIEPAASDAQRATLGTLPPGWAPKVFEARAGDKVLGRIYVDHVVGKTREIDYSLAVGVDGAVLALEILEYRESHGNEVRVLAWRKQFVGKRPSDPVELDRDIKNISGATLSCRHVTEGVHRLLKLHAATKG